MLFMGKDKKIKRNVFVIFFLIYLFYLIVDAKIYSQNSLEKKLFLSHIENFSNPNKVYQGVIVGGSNTLYGISSEAISKKLGINFINISIVGDAYNNSNFDKVLNKIFYNDKKLRELEYVIYSSIKYFNQPPHTNSSKNEFGRNSNFLLPSRSLVERLYNKVIRRDLNNAATIDISLFGDIKSYDYLCSDQDVDLVSFALNEDDLINFLIQKAKTLRANFKDQRIYLLIPPSYTDIEISKSFKDRLLSKISEYNIVVIEEPVIAHKKLYCNSPYHLNKTGRDIRTNNLIDILRINLI